MGIVLPSLLVVLMRYVFNSKPLFEAVAPSLLALFPFVVMFLLASVATLRERTGGTLERLMTMPIAKLDLLVGYALAFSLLALVQVAVVSTLCLTWLGLRVAGPTPAVIVLALLNALLGMALGLLVSAFARTEFQAVQFMPLVVAPQALVCGLFAPRAHMAAVLNWLSDLMPLSYAVDAMKTLTSSSQLTAGVWADGAVIAGCTVLALLVGALTLKRRTA